MDGAPTVLVGTSKGAFLLDEREGSWAVRGPFCNGIPINHVIGDPAGGTIWAGGGNDWSGAAVWRSADGGETWEEARLSRGHGDAWIEENPEVAAQLGLKPAPEAPHTGSVEAIWSLGLAGAVLYAGGKPGALFASTDGGATWTPVEAVMSHPDRDGWNPGAAGLVTHTIVAAPDDPRRIWIGISAAGVFATEDGGATWDRRNRRSNVAAPHAPHPGHPAAGDAQEIGHCVHNMVRAPGGPDLLYQQNHHGVFRSEDGGRSWADITEGLPSTFGFAVGVHPGDPQTIWTIPLNGDTEGRFPVDARAAVWRSRDGGASWHACRDGLPETPVYFTVLRQAMAVDGAAGVYFGTNTGSVFRSADGGDSWREIARHLPTVLSVETLAHHA